MKKIILSLGLLSANVLMAQFKVNVETADSFGTKKMIVYALNGSKDVFVAQVDKKKGKWEVNVPYHYKGMLKAYFPENNTAVNLISENKDISVSLKTDQTKLSGVDYQDEANQKWEQFLALQDKRDRILPVLHQMKSFYNDNSAFDVAMKNEIQRLESIEGVAEDSFIKFYAENFAYASENPLRKLTTEDYQQFLVNSGEMLESSSLMRPVLVNYLRTLSREILGKEVDELLKELNLETPRGQTVLSELLTIFSTYGLTEEKEKYYQKASALTCSINENLKTSINAIKNTSVGGIFKDYTFTAGVKNTKAKKLSEIKADKKVVLFWSSTCPHCLSELPIILEHYQALKQKGIEVIALSLDSDKKSYEETTAALPWINDTELRGWQSSYAETYNVYATPTYYVLDKNNKIESKLANFSAFLSSINVK